MATWNDRPNTRHVLAAAERWKQDCLLNDGSLLIAGSLWTADNVAALRKALLDNPIAGSDKFIDKLQHQLSTSTPAIQRLGAETLWLLYLFVSDSQMSPDAKRSRVTQIWSLTPEGLPGSPLLSDEALAGIAKPGTAFMTKIPDELEYLLRVMLGFKQLRQPEQAGLLSNPWGFGEWVDQQSGGDRRAFRHMLLYLCFPETYERISSWRHKREIRESLSDRLPLNQRDSDNWSRLATDKVLFSIREMLEHEYRTTELDFYLLPLRPLWMESKGGEHNEVDIEAEGSRRFWIEKTIVSGRPDRQQGDHAVGKALWSPQKSKSGGDIYANMRRVCEGDIIFHLTDNEAITGASIAATRVDKGFTGLIGTDWEGPAYRIQLTNYERLDPPLPRDAFLETQPFATELRELADSGIKGLFYNSRRGLNQGAYLTEAGPILVSVLSRAYEAYSGEPLPFEAADDRASKGSSSAYSYTVDDALEALFLERQEIEDILLLWMARKNIILQGPPGVGKSFAAQRLAFALMGAEDRERLGFVQFHQSYSYEDFVEGFRPTETGFELRPGKFVEFCRRAESDPHRTYVFIIDEINRGNLSKILGELMLLIECDKRDTGWAMPLASGKLPFHVPANVNIMGLMNTADRSLAVVDYALRRRFAFVDLKPKLHSPKFRAQLEHAGVPANVVDALIRRIGAVNQAIISDVANLGPGFAIGHSFFCAGPADSENGPTWYARVIRTEIAPLLLEYWFDTPDEAKSWEGQLLAPL